MQGDHNESAVEPTKSKQLRERYERGVYRRQTRDGKTRWEIAYTDRTGRQRWETVASLAEARTRRAELVSKPVDERVGPSRVLFAEFAESWLEGRVKVRPRTLTYNRAALDLVLLPRFGRCRLAAIDADAIVKLTRDLEREGLHAVDPDRPARALSASSVTNYLKPLRGILALAVRRRLIASNPFDVLLPDDRPARVEAAPAFVWSPEAVDALLAASSGVAANAASKVDYTPLLRLTAMLGLRLGEVLGLQWQDFDKAADDDAGVLHVRRQWLTSGVYGPPKTPKAVRSIPLPPGVRDDLIAVRLASSFSLDDDPVFASVSGTPLGHRNVARRGFEAARDRAGLPSSVTFHDLRHAAASRLIRGGLDPVTVAAVLGHSDATTTLRVYGHLWDAAATAKAVRAALAGEG